MCCCLRKGGWTRHCAGAYCVWCWFGLGLQRPEPSAVLVHIGCSWSRVSTIRQRCLRSATGGVIVIGPGLGRDEWAQQCLQHGVAAGPLICDADG